VRNKLRTLYAGAKTDLVIGNIATTFKTLCEYADFSTPLAPKQTVSIAEMILQPGNELNREVIATVNGTSKTVESLDHLQVSALQYHINIVLPDTRDQAVYDAIFKSLREHLG
jgi:hypothetical protein